MTQTEILKGLSSCKDFLCDECPYQKYDDPEYKMRCIHKLIVDLYDLSKLEGVFKQ